MTWNKGNSLKIRKYEDRKSYIKILKLGESWQRSILPCVNSLGYT